MKKTLSIISLASIITFSLFGFMAYIIHSDKVNITKPLPVVVVEVNQNKPDTPPQQKPKALPIPPKAPKPMPKTVTVVDNKGSDLIGEIDVHIKVPSTNTAIGKVGIARDHDARPIVRVSPQYPLSAARDGIEGWVKLAFDINKLGAVVNISIVASSPKRVFDRAAKKALKKWKYKAKSMKGEFVYQANQTVQLDFTIDQNI